MDRRALGSWISGPSSASDTPVAPGDYRGERLGLPETGPGSIAGWGIRIGALFIDWIASSLVARLLFPDLSTSTLGYSFAPLGVFALEVFLFTWLVGGSFGQIILRVRVIGLEGGPPGVIRTFVRTLLLCLAIPPLVWDRDSRGLHDRIAQTVLVRAGAKL